MLLNFIVKLQIYFTKINYAEMISNCSKTSQKSIQKLVLFGVKEDCFCYLFKISLH